MKFIERSILKFQDKDYFSPIRSKIDYARLLVFASRNLLLESEPHDKNQAIGSMKLIVDKMSRLFFYKENKYFSVSFPFNMLLDGNTTSEISTYSGKIVDFKSISSVISVLDSQKFKNNPSVIDFYIDSNEFESTGLSLIEEIFQFEPSYLRYDNDPDNENGDLHPLHHLDINYSQHGTFKLGLTKSMTELFFEDIQNINTICSYIKD